MNDPESKPANKTQPTRLLRTKLFIPHAHPDIVPRRRLVERMNEGLRCKLILVSAPAGFGKTTLLCAWITQLNLPVAWISLDGRDNDSNRFWAYFVAALQTLQPHLGETALAMLQSPQSPPMEAIFTELLNDIAGFSKEFLLVLDDYHAIETGFIHEAITFLLENLPPQAHLVISSRRDPPLPLLQLRVRREMAELHLDDLRFRNEEAAAFLNQVMGLNLAAEDIAALEHRTEGWVAGLQLAAISMQGISNTSNFIRSFAGSHRYVFDYLAQEVLNRQDETRQRFLLQTSILERMCGPLCEAITGDLTSQEILKQLEEANLFLVPLDQQRHWYRYHHLFGDFLRARLEQEAESTQIHSLHRRASDWFASQDEIPEAVSHAIQAEDFERAEALISRIAPEMFVRSELTTIIHWIQSLPEKRVSANSRLSMIFAWALLATGQSQAVEPNLRNIERALGVVADGSPQSLAQASDIRGALGEICNIRGSLAFNQTDLARVKRMSQRSLDYLGEEVKSGLFNSRADIRAVATFNLALSYEFNGEVQAAIQAFTETLTISLAEGNLHLAPMAGTHLANLQVIQGDLYSAEATYRRALHFSGESGRISPLTGMAHTGLGSLLCEWNQLEKAAAHLKQGIEFGRLWTQWEILTSGYLGLARLFWAKNDIQNALSQLQELENLSRKMQVDWAIPMVKAHRALYQIRLEDPEPAAHWAQSCGLNPYQDTAYIREPEAIILARVLTGLDRLDEAIRLGENLSSAAEAGERWGRLTEIQMILSMGRFKSGDSQGASVHLQRALTLAEPQKYLRLFLDEGQPMLELLHQLNGLKGSPVQNYVQKLIRSFGEIASWPGEKSTTGIPAANLRLAEPLSERELEVLELIAQGLTNQEIADQLVISLNTVKSHVKNILNRLEVSNRTQAVSRARETGIL